MIIFKQMRLRYRLAFYLFQIILLFVVAILALSVGSVSIPLPEIIDVISHYFDFSNQTDKNLTAEILLTIRLPRVLLAGLLGGGLSMAGVVFQVLLRNVLADPYILGISGGATVGALLAMTTGASMLFVGATTTCAFIGASCVIYIVYRLSGTKRSESGQAMLLIGVMIGSFLGAVTLGLVAFMGESLRIAIFWLMGYLGNAQMSDVLVVMSTLVPIAVVLLFFSARLNILSLGWESAHSVGLAILPTHLSAYFFGSAITAISVSFAGSIGFIGLLVPHISRSIVGPDHRILMSTSFFIGAIFLILADTLSRALFAPFEFPVGAITAAIGAPLFLFLIKRKS